jgi:hypothetical protein
MIKIFCGFWPIFVMINFWSEKSSSKKTRQFFAKFFGDNILDIDPWISTSIRVSVLVFTDSKAG